MKQETRKVDMADQEKEGENAKKLNMEDQEKEGEKAKKLKLILLIINCVLLSIGTCVGPLIMRLYFIHGGKRVWLSSFLETAGFPVMIIPLAVSYMNHRKNHHSPPPKIISMKPPLFFISAILGIIVGFDDYLYAYGVARLPVSTSALIIASQLAFTAVFAYFLVKHKFTAYSINAVVVLTIGAGVLALNTSGDLPHGESHKEYVMGFIATVLAAVIYGFLLPLIEFVYQKIKQPLTYSLVLEIQFVLCLFATLFCVVGMIVNNDFKVIPREAREFELGEVTYYVVMVASGIIWQTFYLGAIGVIFSGSSLLSAVLIAVFLPVTEVFAVIFYKEKFQAEKGVSLVLSLWGFVSYFYGESKQAKKQNENRSIKPEIEGTQTRGTSGL